MNRKHVGLAALAAMLVLGDAGCSTPCGPSNCGGCCDPSGICEAPSASFCGLGGNVCNSCAGLQSCNAGVCAFESGTNGTVTGTTAATSTSGSMLVTASTTTSSGAVNSTGGTTASPGSTGGTSTTTNGSSGTTGVQLTTSNATSSTGAATTSSGGTSGTCPSGVHTTISGTITDPAGIDPLFDVVAYVPTTSVEALPTGATCASCESLYSGNPIAAGLSDDHGQFVIQDVPVGANVPVILQVGKWRTHATVLNVMACQDNPLGTIQFPSKMDPNDPILNMPDIAVSTGSADSLECLLVRMGIDSSEYVPGASTAGKVHIFNGGSATITTAGGAPEANPMVGAPNSDAQLWNSAQSLANYDMVFLSCEGDETYDAMPANLATYLDSEGGRVFASHFHYAWFTGATEQQSPSYAGPSEWGTEGNLLAAWDPMGMGSDTTADGAITTAAVSGAAFPKGAAFAEWLSNLRALGTSGATSTELYVSQPRENAVITASNPNSQNWITDPATNASLNFSFNTPLGVSGATCPGRAIFSGLHVGGASYDSVNCALGTCPTGSPAPAPPPAGCDTTHGLSPQEKALEFMLFDLSSCIIPDAAYPADAGIVPTLQ